MRHGPAGEPIEGDPEAERNRELTPAGVKLVTAMAKAMKREGEKPKIIYASKWARTQQTADIVGGILGVGVDLIDECNPHMPLAPFIAKLIEADNDVHRPMIVGHSDNLLPALEELGEAATDDIAKGEVRRLKVDRETGAMKETWRLCPADIGLEDDVGE